MLIFALAIDKMNFLHRTNKPIQSGDAFIRSRTAFRDGKCIIGTNGSYRPFWEREKDQEKNEEKNRKIEAEKIKKEKEQKIIEEQLKKYYNFPSEQQKELLDRAVSELDNFSQQQYRKNGLSSYGTKLVIELKIVEIMASKNR